MPIAHLLAVAALMIFAVVFLVHRQLIVGVGSLFALAVLGAVIGLQPSIVQAFPTLFVRSPAPRALHSRVNRGGHVGEQLWKGRGIVRAVYPKLIMITREEIFGLLPPRTTGVHSAHPGVVGQAHAGDAARFWLLGQAMTTTRWSRCRRGRVPRFQRRARRHGSARLPREHSPCLVMRLLCGQVMSLVLAADPASNAGTTISSHIFRFEPPSAKSLFAPCKSEGCQGHRHPCTDWCGSISHDVYDRSSFALRILLRSASSPAWD